MEFLRPILGEALYEQVQRKLRGQKDIKLANLALGQYVDKRKFKAKAAALEKAEEKIKTLERALESRQMQAMQFILTGIDGILGQGASGRIFQGRTAELAGMSRQQMEAFVPEPRSIGPDTKITLGIEEDVRKGLYDRLGIDMRIFEGAADM